MKDRALDARDGRGETLDHLGQLGIGARVGGREQDFVSCVAIFSRMSGANQQTQVERGVVDD